MSKNARILCGYWIAKDPRIGQADSKGFDQTLDS